MCQAILTGESLIIEIDYKRRISTAKPIMAANLQLAALVMTARVSPPPPFFRAQVNPEGLLQGASSDCITVVSFCRQSSTRCSFFSPRGKNHPDVVNLTHAVAQNKKCHCSGGCDDACGLDGIAGSARTGWARDDPAWARDGPAWARLHAGVEKVCRSVALAVIWPSSARK